MIDAVAYRASEISAKRGIADWRLSNVSNSHIFHEGFPVSADSFLDLAQILDTMHEGRFDHYMREIGGFTDEEASFFVKVCLDYIDFHRSCFQQERVVVPLSALIADYLIYRKLLAYEPAFKRLLEIGPGCGYLSFFLRHHGSLVDYSQIESTESFYLLQSHIDSYVFGSRFAEHALPKQALEDQCVYVPKVNWHNSFHYEEQKAVHLEAQPICNHFPWWRIGEVASRQYDIITSNANLNEFERTALFQYLSLINDVLADDGAIIAQCLGGLSGNYESLFADMKSAGFVPVAFIPEGGGLAGRTFHVANAVFVGKRHPLYTQYAGPVLQSSMMDRGVSFINRMYFLNEERAEHRLIRAIPDILNRILDEIEPHHHLSTPTSNRINTRALRVESSDLDNAPKRNSIDSQPETLFSSAHLRDVNKANVARWKTASRVAAEVEILKRQIEVLQSSRSWRITAPLRSLGGWVRRRLPFAVRLARRLRG